MSGWRIVAVNDAYRLLPVADILYACDAKWWKHHDGAKSIEAERWSSHNPEPGANDNKTEVAEKYGINLVRGVHNRGFSVDPAVIHYGSNSGFQAINLPILKGATAIALVGFDMRRIEGRAHFFAEHPDGLVKCTDYERFVSNFTQAAKTAPLPIINWTVGSAIGCFEFASLDDCVRRYGSESHGIATGEGAASGSAVRL